MFSDKLKKNQSEKYSVLIIGCGNIAGGFDEENKDNITSLTHADAFQKHDSFNLTACIDPDIDKLKIFQERWGIDEAYTSLDIPLKEKKSYDVVCICSPTDLHAKHLQSSIELKPRLVFCEKPLTNNLDGTKEIIRGFIQNNILLAVNFSRRWMPDMELFRKDLMNGRWGKVRSVVGHYNKGLLNNGSHMIDLLHFLFGDLTPRWVGDYIFDYTDDDPSMPVLLSSEEEFNIFLNVTNSADFSFFEISFFLEKGVVTLENGGHLWNIRESVDNKDYKGFRTLSSSISNPAEYNLVMNRAVQNIHDALSKNTKLKSDGSNAMKALEVCKDIKEFSY